MKKLGIYPVYDPSMTEGADFVFLGFNPRDFAYRRLIWVDNSENYFVRIYGVTFNAYPSDRPISDDHDFFFYLMDNEIDRLRALHRDSRERRKWKKQAVAQPLVRKPRVLGL